LDFAPKDWGRLHCGTGPASNKKTCTADYKAGQHQQAIPCRDLYHDVLPEPANARARKRGIMWTRPNRVQPVLVSCSPPATISCTPAAGTKREAPMNQMNWSDDRVEQ